MGQQAGPGQPTSWLPVPKDLGPASWPLSSSELLSKPCAPTFHSGALAPAASRSRFRARRRSSFMFFLSRRCFSASPAAYADSPRTCAAALAPAASPSAALLPCGAALLSGVAGSSDRGSDSAEPIAVAVQLSQPGGSVELPSPSSPSSSGPSSVSKTCGPGPLSLPHTVTLGFRGLDPGQVGCEPPTVDAGERTWSQPAFEIQCQRLLNKSQQAGCKLGHRAGRTSWPLKANKLAQRWASKLAQHLKLN